MRKSLQKTFSGVIAVVMILTTVFANTVFTFAAEQAEPTGKIWLIGDSTVCNYGTTGSTPYDTEPYNYRQGWGMRLADYFDGVTVQNIAASGRSARSFIVRNTSAYRGYKNDVAAGDYVFIQFGHNDASEPFRLNNGVFSVNGSYGRTDQNQGTSAAANLPNWTDGIENGSYNKFDAVADLVNGGYVEVPGIPVVEDSFTETGKIASFEAFIYEYYVKPALDKGAYPVLVTAVVRGQGPRETDSHGERPYITVDSISRGHEDNTWSVTATNVTDEAFKDAFKNMNYIQAMYNVSEYAATQGYDVPVIDLYNKSADYWESYIEEHGNADDLHANECYNDAYNAGGNNDLSLLEYKGKDRTHLSRQGATVAAGFVAEGVKEQNLPLAKFLKDSSGEGDDTTEPPIGDDTTEPPVGDDDVEYGNVDGKAGVTPNDASMVMDYVLSKASYTGDKAKFEKAANVDGDTAVTAKDAAEILKKAMNSGFKFSGVNESDRPVETTTENESAEITTADESVETTTGEQQEVDPSIQNTYYEGFDVVVDARANSDPDRVVDGKEQPIFRTVNGALASEQAQAGGTEDDPVVIGIVPGLYREQVVVDKPYITFKKIENSTSTDEDVTLTWYWMTNYTYDNIGADGSVDMSMPNKDGRYTGKMPNWGRSTWVKSGATGFRAENIYFEHSGNLYMTQEEKDANVRPLDANNNDTGKPDRMGLPVGEGVGTSADNDVRASKWIERGSALFTEADKATYINCKVIGTQDSLGAYNGRAYFKDCYLAGQVDFICGHAQAVFDNCTIHWQSSPYEDTGSALTASNNGAAPARGYLFWNCNIEGGERTTRVQFARPWGGVSTETAWINTKITKSPKDSSQPIVSDGGWGSMSGANPQDVRAFVEYNTTYKDSTDKVDTSKRTGTTNGILTGGVLDGHDVVKYNPYMWTAYNQKGEFDGWDPTNSAADYGSETGVEKDIDSVTVPAEVTENFTLPEAPSGYTVKWVITGTYRIIDGVKTYTEDVAAVIGADGKSVTITRPNFGQYDMHVEFAGYFKKGDTIVGAEKCFDVTVKASTDRGETFNMTGKIKLSKIPSADLPVTLNFVTDSGSALCAPINATVPAGQTEVSYDGGSLYIDKNIDITVRVTINGENTEKWAPRAGTIQKIAAVSADTLNYDIEFGTTETVEFKNDFEDGQLLKGAVTAGSGLAVENVAESDTNKVLKLTSSSGANNSTVYSTNLVDWIKNDNKSLEGVDKVIVSYRIKLENKPSGNFSFVDIANGLLASGADQNQTPDNLFARADIGGQWDQINLISKSSKGNAGLKDRFLRFGSAKFANNAGAWYTITVNIDFATKEMSGSVALDGTDTISNFDMSGAKDGDGSVPIFPTSVSKDNLTFAFYPTNSGGEWYMDDVSISFEAFE